jgi:hypothetical protein
VTREFPQVFEGDFKLPRKWRGDFDGLAGAGMDKAQGARMESEPGDERFFLAASLVSALEPRKKKG